MLKQIKADGAKRVFAVVIDFLIAAVIFYVLNFFLGGTIASLAAGSFLLFRDSLPIRDLGGASIGKKVLGLKALQGNGKPCDHLSSIKRNLTIALGYLIYTLISILAWVFSFIPYFGWLFSFAMMISGILWLLAIAMELFKVFSDERGIRLGDLLADTQVVEVRRHHDSIPDHLRNADPGASGSLH